MEYPYTQPNQQAKSVSVHKSIGIAWNQFLENWRESSVVLIPFGLIFGFFLYSQIDAIVALFQKGEFNEESIENLGSSGNLGNVFNVAYYFLFAALIRLQEFKKSGKTVTMETFRVGDFFHLRDLLLLITMFLWVIFAMVGFIFLVIPGFYIANLFMMALVVSTKTDSYFIDSIKDTMSLTKGHWWKIAYMNSIFYIPGMLAFVAVGLYSIITMRFDGLTGLGIVASAVFGYSVVMPIYVNASCELYNSMRETKTE
ncbi:MAG: hypothetical protein JJT78_08415 [Leptospira sp.]|nr:hypothetical protein [Leptospira sp.]